MTNDKLFESIASNLNIGICVYDPKGNFVYVNPKMIQWRKISYQQYLSMNVHDFFKDGRVEDCIFDRVMNTRAAVTRLQYYQEWKPQTSEKKRLRLVSGVPIFDSSGNICNVITYLQDIEEYNEKLMKLCSHAGDIMLVKAPQKYEDTALSGQNSIIAESIAMRDVLKQARNVASTDAAVILYGESGTGKQVIAEYIFENSLRKFKPFVEVNCAAFAENLLESELFGYEKGSFTGALNSGKKGLVEAADGGTLFLDEVNSLPMSLQGKFLHLIEKKSFRRVGSNKTQYADFRLISATNMDLKKMVDDNTFRADLYYRLNVLPLHIPPLRDRKEDIIPLCNYFIMRTPGQNDTLTVGNPTP